MLIHLGVLIKKNFTTTNDKDVICSAKQDLAAFSKQITSTYIEIASLKREVTCLYQLYDLFTNPLFGTLTKTEEAFFISLDLIGRIKETKLKIYSLEHAGVFYIAGYNKCKTIIEDENLRITSEQLEAQNLEYTYCDNSN